MSEFVLLHTHSDHSLRGGLQEPPVGGVRSTSGNYAEGRSGRGIGHRPRIRPVPADRCPLLPKAFAKGGAKPLLPGHLVVAAGRVEGGSEREMDARAGRASS